MLIAATAWRHDLVVVTRNSKDFVGTSVPVYNPFDS
jgi:toxin FitB